MPYFALRGLILVCLGLFAGVAHSAEPPRLLDTQMNFEPFCNESEVVTPIGATFDGKGRLLVIESHTHKRDSKYKGPATDRILLVEDTNGDGKSDQFNVFYDGTEFTMSLLRGADDWIYVATRMKIFRIRDTNGDDRADEVEPIVHLETKGNYPHNGLSGLTFDNEGRLLFGIGENLGANYRLVAADGSAQSGAGEGGVFRCTSTGKKLTRLATGLWNPFGMCVDKHDRIFAVGNDPDGSPPCRLIQIIETGDYGFQFKYGRSGRHPLQAWNGELPGTLPMVSGTGEAPCEMVIYHGRLWVASWGHNRIERYELLPVGASFRAKREIVVQGDEHFRPVGFAIAPDGSLYVTDWVDRSYPVHGKGRIWRLSWKGTPPANELPTLSTAEVAAKDASMKADWNALKTDDVFLRQSAVAGIARLANLGEKPLNEWADPRQRLGYVQAMRWKLDHARADKADPPIDFLKQAISDSDADVRLLAVRWIADANIKELRDNVKSQLTLAATPELFRASLAAIEILDTGKASFDPRKSSPLALPYVIDESQPAAMRRLALRMIPSDHESLNDKLFAKLLASEDRELQRAAIRSMAASPRVGELKELAKVVIDERFRVTARADAVVGLARNRKSNEGLLRDLSAGKGVVADEARRALSDSPEQPSEVDRPAAEDLDGWLAKVEKGGDAEAGWRVFFRQGASRCANCHRFEGGGANVGPDLTGLVTRSSRRRVLQSLLEPSRDVAPQYVPSMIQTSDGRVHTGLWQGYDDVRNVELFLAADGRRFEIDPAAIEIRQTSNVSIMPADIHSYLSVDDVQNLLALLEGE